MPGGGGGGGGAGEASVKSFNNESDSDMLLVVHQKPFLTTGGREKLFLQKGKKNREGDRSEEEADSGPHHLLEFEHPR